jgi:hypothetical protein
MQRREERAKENSQGTASFSRDSPGADADSGARRGRGEPTTRAANVSSLSSNASCAHHESVSSPSPGLFAAERPHPESTPSCASCAVSSEPVPSRFPSVSAPKPCLSVPGISFPRGFPPKTEFSAPSNPGTPTLFAPTATDSSASPDTVVFPVDPAAPSGTQFRTTRPIATGTSGILQFCGLHGRLFHGDTSSLGVSCCSPTTR